MLAGACADAGGAMVLVLRKKLKCETDFLGTDFLGTDLKKEKKTLVRCFNSDFPEEGGCISPPLFIRVTSFDS
jgi:hypothetical protein